LVRGVNIPAEQVAEWEEKYEATLVPDEEVSIIYALDMAYKDHWNYYGKPPERVTINSFDPFVEYIPHQIKVFVPLAGPVPVQHKPAWFRRSKPFIVTR
jgi:hypothetical protein